jgi:hypothetical protein
MPRDTGFLNKTKYGIVSTMFIWFIIWLINFACSRNLILALPARPTSSQTTDSIEQLVLASVPIVGKRKRRRRRRMYNVSQETILYRFRRENLLLSHLHLPAAAAVAAAPMGRVREEIETENE